MTATLTYERCHGTFGEAWTGAEQRAEARANGFDPDTDPAVCEPGYREILARPLATGLHR